MPYVELRLITDADSDALFDHSRDPEAVWMGAFTSRNPDDRAAFDAHLARVLAAPDVTMRAVVSDGKLAGSIAAYGPDGEKEVTYTIGRAFWGQGIASQALRLLLGLVPVRPLHARAASDNLGSLRVLRKAGFRAVGTEHSYANARRTKIEETILQLD